MKNLLASAAIRPFRTQAEHTRELINADEAAKVGLQAYDPVGFHTEGKALKGDPGIAARHEGITYYFASKENRKAFEADPEKFLPAYGGYCAYGISVGALFPVEISTWEIVDGKLVLQYSDDVKTLFKKDERRNFEKAEKNWPKLVEKNSK